MIGAQVVVELMLVDVVLCSSRKRGRAGEKKGEAKVKGERESRVSVSVDPSCYFLLLPLLLMVSLVLPIYIVAARPPYFFLSHTSPPPA